MPSDYMGMVAQSWPNGYPADSDSPEFHVPIYRVWDHKTSDNQYLLWLRMNPSPGVFAWDEMDEIVEEMESRGSRGWFTLGGTPSWAAVGTAYADPYGNSHGASAADPAAVSAFITALMTRYNGNGRRFFKYAEPWNEPEFSGGGSNFYRGTAPQLAAVARAVYQAAKAVDPTCIVTSPSDWSAVGHIDEFFVADDGAGGVGGDWMDAICLHPYYRWWDYDDYLAFGTGAIGSSVGVYSRAVRSALVTAGYSHLPVLWGESGYSSSSTSVALLAAKASAKPSAVFASWAVRVGIAAALEGAQCFVMYDWDGTLTLSGSPESDPLVAQAWAFVSSLCGKTIINVSRVAGYARYRIECDDGSIIMSPDF